MDCYAKIENKSLKFHNLDKLKTFLRPMPEGQLLKVNIEKRKNIRSLKFNAFYWSAIIPAIVDYTGEDSETLHGIFKKDHLPRKYITIAGKRRLKEPTTTDLSDQEFGVFVEKVMAWSAQELGMEWNIN